MSRRRRKKIPSEPFTAHIESLSHDGQGISRIDGKTTFIFGALPSEEVRFIYQEKKSQYDKGYCIDVIKPATIRTEPKCQHYELCGGCSMQHVEPKAQIETKEKILVDLLNHHCGQNNAEVLSPLRGPHWGYRHKTRLSVRYVQKKESVLVGFRERRSGRFIANIDECHVLHPKVGKLIDKLKSLIASLSNYSDIAQIEVACTSEQTVLILRHLSALTTDDLDKLKALAKEEAVIWYLQPGGEESIHPLEEAVELSYEFKQLGLKFQFKPTDFTQVNPEINEKMVEQALNLLDIKKDERVLDLFCGLGNFSLPMALHAKEVIGVEGDEKMVARAASNAKMNNIDNAQFFKANLFDSIVAAPWLKGKFDKLLIDPPRSGALNIANELHLIKPKRIVYVSCSPQTLARDAALIIDKGYRLDSYGVMDMFPHTAHVESIAVFNKTGL